MEYFEGQNLYDYVNSKKEGCLSETESRKLTKDIINVMVYLHGDKNVAHR
jgi:serine/threonine protein kinase